MHGLSAQNCLVLNERLCDSRVSAVHQGGINDKLMFTRKA